MDQLEETFDFIVDYFAKHTIAPSLDDIKDATGVCKATARDRVGKLIEQGRLRRMDNKPRALIVVGARWIYDNGS